MFDSATSSIHKINKSINVKENLEVTNRKVQLNKQVLRKLNCQRTNITNANIKINQKHHFSKIVFLRAMNFIKIYFIL